jgi:RNA polymerase sigma-70 factor, ECF subfamily
VKEVRAMEDTMPCGSALDAAAARWHSGDADAAQDVWELCGARLIRVARALVRCKPAAEDAVQEAILRAWRSIGRYHPNMPFEPWITTILIRECRRALRRGNRNQPSVTEKDLSVALPDRALFEAIAALPQDVREAVVLHYLHGYNISETAGVMGIPAGTVKSRLFRARKLLAAELKEEIQ